VECWFRWLGGGHAPAINGFSIDGVDDNRLDINGPTQPVIQESVAEFTLLTNQFGGGVRAFFGGQFNIVTKSGTKRLARSRVVVQPQSAI